MPEAGQQARAAANQPDFDPLWEPESGLTDGAKEGGFSASAGHGTLYSGRMKFFSHDGEGISGKDHNSCGQQAIATMLDFWDAGSFGFQRTYPGKRDSSPRAKDGRMHYPPPYVGAVYQAYPPGRVPFLPQNTEFTMSHQIEGAFRSQGLAVEACHSKPWGDGAEELAILKKWVGGHRIPAVILLDLAKVGAGLGDGLHWAIIFGYSDREVLMASWSEVYELSWDQFMSGWKCDGVPWPHNFHAIFPYKPR